MLRFLRIQHLAVIDSVEVEFDPGLNVLTGETGAGKSMLVEAVGPFSTEQPDPWLAYLKLHDPDSETLMKAWRAGLP